MLMMEDVSAAARRVHELFLEKGLTLSVAESCTGGFIGSALAALPGASGYFKGGVIAYSGDVKRNVLGVSPDTLSTHGMVSEATARAMAERARALCGTDYALATTGNLGPDVLEGKEQGLVYLAACKEGKTVAVERRFPGDRLAAREQAAREALALLIELANGPRR